MTKTYLQLAREIATLQAAADKQLAAEKKEAVVRLNEVIAKYDLSAADLRFPGAGAAGGQTSAKVKPVSGPAAGGAKYADGMGRTWGGRGPRPQWLREAIAAGKSLESFMASASTATATAAAPMSPIAPPSATAKVPSKKAGFSVAPKYRHPGTGDTWSGRGSAPRWLKEALRKRGTKLDDFLIGAPTSTAPTGSSPKTAKAAAVAQRPVVASTQTSPKPSAKVASVKAAAAKKATGPKASPKRGPAAKKASVGTAHGATSVKKATAKKAISVPAPAPAMPSIKKAVAAKKSAVATKPVATKVTTAPSKSARKVVSAKKSSAPTSAPAVSAGVSASPAPSGSSAASEAAATSPVV